MPRKARTTLRAIVRLRRLDRQESVDSYCYTTINIYRTIEQILGMSPQNQLTRT
jgi:hypothetical protein